MRVADSLRRLKGRVLGRPDLDWYRREGAVIGEDVHLGPDTVLDPPHCWLITVGDRVTFAPRVLVLAHDASTKGTLGLTVVAPVVIGDDVFVGAGALILPGVTIGAGSVVGAASVVSRDVEPGTVVTGNPAVAVGTVAEMEARHRARMVDSEIFDLTFTHYGDDPITPERKAQMRERLRGRRGYCP